MEATASAVMTPIIQRIVVEVPAETDISTVIVAWLGLIISLFLAGFEVYKYWNNRGKLHIDFGFDIPTIARDQHGHPVRVDDNKKLWTLSLTNSGSKSINIAQIAVEHKGKKMGTFLTEDFYKNGTRFTIEPDRSKHFTFDYEVIHPKDIKKVHLMDEVKKTYKKKMKYKESETE